MAHVSVLLKRLTKLSGLSMETLGEWLLKCAIERGASHYEREFPATLPSDIPALSDEEIGVALCGGGLPYEPVYIRAAAQLLSSPQTDDRRLAHLARMERVEPVLLYVADVAARYASEQHPWLYLREHLNCRRHISTSALPHWSRFVSQTGITPFNRGPRIDWLARRELVR